MIARALTIAGSDCSGGAGVQSDLKTFTVQRVYGMTAVTALTVQNTQGVEDIFPVPPSLVARQIAASASDIGVDAVKTGMLYAAETVTAVARALVDHRISCVVVDPVLIAQSGTALGRDDLPAALLEELVPRALLVTPNIHEAQALTGIEVRTVADMRSAARRLVRSGARACLVKGGHLESEDAVDIYDDGSQWREISAARLAVRHTHGTGCQLSAAIAGFLARGLPLDDAVLRAKDFITRAIAAGLPLGRGVGPANPLAWEEDR